jgi:hypothetical protein
MARDLFAEHFFERAIYRPQALGQRFSRRLIAKVKKLFQRTAS